MAMKHSRAGFTLISVMIALVMMSIGVLALSRTLTASVEANTRAASRTVALDIARQRMEFLRAQPSASLSGYAQPSGIKVDGDGRPNSEGAYTRSVIMNGLRTGLMQVTVRVEWPRMTTPVELVTYFYTGG